MNFVKKLFHNQQQQRASNNHRHAAAATDTAITTSSVATSSEPPTATARPTTAATATAAGQSESPAGHQQQQLVNKHFKKTKHSRRRHPLRLRKTKTTGEEDNNDSGDNDDDDDNNDDATVEHEQNGNAWKFSPFSSPANSPNRRRERTSNSSGGRPGLRLDTDTTSAESASVGSRAGTPTNASRNTTPKTTATTSGSSRTAVAENATTPTDVVTREIKLASCRHVARVLPNLLLGSQEIANDLRGLRHYNVTHVLNVTVEVPDRFPDLFVYKRIAISDMPSAKLVPHFDDAFRFIDIARSTPGDGCVLVHCYYGHSRSASFVIGYLMVVERMRYVDALRYLQLLRPGVRPNDGFQRQLKHYESTMVKRLRQQSAAAIASAAACAAARNEGR